MELAAFVLIAVTISAVLWALVTTSRAHRQLTETKIRLGSYLPGHLVDEVLQRRDQRPRAMVHQRVTVAVFRVRNFSSLIERLDHATALKYLNECYLLCGTAVHRNGGVIERLLEDGIVAVFGIRKDEDENHEYRGIRAGLEAARLISAMTTHWEHEGRRPLRLAVGVNSGPIIAGDVGFAERRSFALVGGTVAVAHQLESICVEINAAVVASAAAYEPVESRFVALPIKQIPLRHMNEFKDTYIIRGLSESEGDAELTLPVAPVLRTMIEVVEPGNFAPPQIAREVGVFRRLNPAVEDARFREDYSNTAIVPDPMWPATYEDDNGPPIHVDG